MIRRKGEFEVEDIPDLQRKVVLLTGGYREVREKKSFKCWQKREQKCKPLTYTKTILSTSSDLTDIHRFVCCRSPKKATDLFSSIKNSSIASSTPLDVQSLIYDASSLQSVHNTAQEFLKLNLPLDILVRNAGAIVDFSKPTDDGIEWIFAVNHLAHFALFAPTVVMMPALKCAAENLNADVRIVSTTSAGFVMHPDPSSLHISDRELKNRSDDLWWRGAMPMYGRSKNCNILFTKDLGRRLHKNSSPDLAPEGSNFQVNSAHPGTVGTGLNASVRSGWYLWALESMVYWLVAVGKP